MDRHKAIVVSDWKYIKSRDTNRLANALKYYQYRDDRTWDKAAQTRVLTHDRWLDRGLGTNYSAIQQSCTALRGKHVEAWTWVINPDPALMQLIPEESQRDVMVELTDSIVEAYYEARGVPVPEYSFVIHDRLTKTGGEQQGLPDLHTHVVLPGTVLDPDNLNRRTNFYNNVDRGHDVMLRDTTTRAFEEILDRAIGLEWRTRHLEPAEIERSSAQPFAGSSIADDGYPRIVTASQTLELPESPILDVVPSQEQFGEISLEQEIKNDLDDPQNWDMWFDLDE